MSRLCRLIALLVIISISTAATPIAATEQDIAAAARVARDTEERLLASLHNQVKVEWSNAPLGQVLESLAKAAGVNLWIDREGLSEEGISLEDSVVELHLGEASVWQTLHFLLKPLALDWHGSDGVLSITTQARANEMLITRNYDVKALVAALEPQLKHLPARQFSHLGIDGTGNFCGGPGGFFQIADRAESNDLPAFVLPQFGGGFGPGGPFNSGIPIRNRSSKIRGEDLLAGLLMEVIATPWEDIDGEGGAISFGQRRLIVRQSYQAHFQIRQLLHVLEEFVVRGAKSKSIRIGRPGYPHEEDTAIFNHLAEPQDIDIKSTPLDQALAELAQEGPFRLWIDKESLSAEGIDVEQTVALKLTGTTLDTVLHKLLDPLVLRFVVEEGTLVITTAAKADEMMSTRVCFTGDVPEARAASDLLTAIQKATSGRWRDLDGDGGALWKAVPDWLVIQQSYACHQETAALLDDLRQAEAVSVEPPAPQSEVRLYPVSDASALDDLIRSLPTLIPGWNAEQGSIVPLGQSLAIKQPAEVHDRLNELFSALDHAHIRLNPHTPKPKESPKPVPATK